MLTSCGQRAIITTAVSSLYSGEVLSIWWMNEWVNAWMKSKKNNGMCGDDQAKKKVTNKQHDSCLQIFKDLCRRWTQSEEGQLKGSILKEESSNVVFLTKVLSQNNTLTSFGGAVSNILEGILALGGRLLPRSFFTPRFWSSEILLS